MRKLDLILENVRDEYMINLLEEGSTTELETLKTKKFLNENLNRIRKMLVEEGALEGVKQHLGNNWGKYLAGAGTLGVGALAANHFLGGEDVYPEGEAGPNTQAQTYAENPGSRIADPALQNAQSAATQSEADAILNPHGNQGLEARAGNPALQNAQSAATQDEADAILNAQGVVAPEAGKLLGFADGVRGTVNNVGTTYDNMTNGLSNAYNAAMKNITTPGGPEVR